MCVCVRTCRYIIQLSFVWALPSCKPAGAATGSNVISLESSRLATSSGAQGPTNLYLWDKETVDLIPQSVEASNIIFAGVTIIAPPPAPPSDSSSSQAASGAASGSSTASATGPAAAAAVPAAQPGTAAKAEPTTKAEAAAKPASAAAAAGSSKRAVAEPPQKPVVAAPAAGARASGAVQKTAGDGGKPSGCKTGAQNPKGCL